MEQIHIKEKQFISSKCRKKLIHDTYISAKCWWEEGDIFKKYFRNLNISQIISWVCHMKKIVLKWNEYDFLRSI